MSTKHFTSDRLQDRHPYRPNAPENRSAFSKDSENQSEVYVAYGNQCWPNLVQSLNVCDESNEQHIIDILQTMIQCISNEESKIDAVRNRCMEAVANLHAHSNALIRELAARIFIRLFSCYPGRVNYDFVVDHMLDGIEDESVTVREQAAKALTVYATYSDGMNFFLQNPERIARIVKSVPDTLQNFKANKAKLEIIERLASQAHCVLKLLENDVVERVLELVQIEKFGLLISQICWYFSESHEGRVALLAADAALKLKPNVISDDEDLKRIASAALLGLSTEKEGKIAIGGIADSIVHMIFDGWKSPGYENAVQIVLSASEVPDTREKFVGLLLVDAARVVQVFGTSCIKDIVALLRKRPVGGNLIEPATSVLCDLISGDDEQKKNTKLFYESLQSIETIVEVARLSEKHDVKRYCTVLLQATEKMNATGTERRLKRFAQQKCDKGDEFYADLCEKLDQTEEKQSMVNIVLESISST